ncbi:N-acetyltransferase [Candidatus Bathycorpusculum sp.]|uniref:GNAT family N-acetyltransferase n=1 Tax=Candidatus Bathycorpusculum sp. TaxID=2994959 RepID=UPI0031CC868C
MVVVLIIRQETRLDYAEVYRLVKISFATVSNDDGAVPDYLNEREKDVFVPELSLVAQNDDGQQIIGQIVLYKTPITTPRGERIELLLSPICVHPNYFRHGIARAMVNEALSRAKHMGFGAVFLCGDPKIYRNLGFLPSYHYGIFHKNDLTKTVDWSMVCELYPGALNGVSGTVNTI